MRFSPFLPLIAVTSFLLNGALLLNPALGQSYDDVQVRKNPDGSIETFDTSDGPSSSVPRGRSGSGYKKSSHRYNDGVTVRKNPDGSIETFDSGGGSSPRHASGGHSSSRSVKQHSDGAVKKPADESTKAHAASASKPSRPQASSGGAFQFVHKYSKGVTVKKNPDGTIEVIGSESDLINPGGSSNSKSAEKSHSSAKANSSAKPGTSSKASSSKPSSTSKASASRPKHRTAHRSRGRGNFGDVRVIRNPDGSIETYDAN